jgi:charged multivesicular body protein 3
MTEWKAQLRREMNSIDREIRTAQRKEEEIKKDIRQHAKRGPEGDHLARLLARELVGFRKGVERMYQGKSHLNTIRLHSKMCIEPAVWGKRFLD